MWVIGSGGLIGSAIASQSTNRFQADSIDWDAESVVTQLCEQFLEYRKLCQDLHTGWEIYWCAGKATVSSSAEATERELRIFTEFIEFISRQGDLSSGKFFLTSSAGGIYAGSNNPPFTLQTIPAPISEYGTLKLMQEQCVIEKLSPLLPVVIGRMSNIYGPGQNLSKLQGLISHLVWSCITRQPTNLFVPLETIRDYLFVKDAAILATTAMAQAHPGYTIHILASGEPVTVAELVSLTQSVSRRKVPIALGVHDSSSKQSLDLRLQPTMSLPRNSTDLLSGIKQVYLDNLSRVQNVGTATH